MEKKIVPASFATPIAHQESEEYSAYENALMIGRPFRQPLLSLGNPAEFSPGLELFIKADTTLCSVFAAFNGVLSWIPGTAEAPGDRIELAVDQGVRKMLNKLPLVESPLARMVYENLDRQEVQNALTAILQQAYAQANTSSRNTWHPAMTAIMGGGAKGDKLKTYLGKQKDPTQAISDLITTFVDAQPSALLKTIPVLAGQRIGQAAPYLPSDPLPSKPVFPLGAANDPQRARRLTITTPDVNRQRINPLYHLHEFMHQKLALKEKQFVHPLTAIPVENNILKHPVTRLYAAPNTPAVRPDARLKLQEKNAYCFPIGELMTFHGFPAVPPEKPNSFFEWRYAEDGKFEVRDRSDKPDLKPPRYKPTPKEIARAERIHVGINKICAALQVPCELIIAVMGTESNWLKEKKPPKGGKPENDPVKEPELMTDFEVRFESLVEENKKPQKDKPEPRKQRTALRNAGFLESYDQLIGAHGKISNLVNGPDKKTTTFDLELDEIRTWGKDFLRVKHFLTRVGDGEALILSNSASEPTKKKYKFTVNGFFTEAREAWVLEGQTVSTPLPLMPNALVRPGASSLTWSQAATVINLLKGDRVSPVAMQTLIATALTSLSFVERAAPELYCEMKPVDKQPGKMLEWLETVENSVLAGAAKIRMDYNAFQRTWATGFDLTLVGAAYNANMPIKTTKSRKDAKGNLVKENHKPVLDDVPTNWGLVFYSLYIERAGPMFNAAMEYFSKIQDQNLLPSVRFCR